ncbi:MAG: LPS export ABC transporter periplasmic protein LptC [Mesorhizobium sp.]|nr:LPS export ABC transporter periplasmic protein LptC [Mesorhizobium sp.]MCO5160758.1 LPS export ABC transporter periplasmic protein LptC [Mesorhizobium sp.]
MTAARTTGIDNAQTQPLAPGARTDDVFVRAQRHSRRVRWLKVWLPGLAFAGVIGFIGWSYLSIPTVAGIDIEGAAISDGKLVMANPKLDGFTKDKLPYTMTAQRAVQDLKDTSLVRLEDIDARLPVDPKNTAKVVAKSGVYDNGKNTMVFDSPMTITTTDGMTARLNSASLDMNAGSMSTSDPVEILLNGSKITALSMNMADNGRVIVFENRVRVDIEPRTSPEKAASGDKNAVN